MEDKVTVSVQATTKDMIVYHFYNAYYKTKGILNMAISAICLVVYLSGYIKEVAWAEWVMIFMAAFFPIIYPLVLILKSVLAVNATRKQKVPIDYTFSKKGINLSQGENTLDIQWSDVFFIKETKSSIYIYITAKSAFIFPKEQIKGNVENIKNLLKENVEIKRTTFLES